MPLKSCILSLCGIAAIFTLTVSAAVAQANGDPGASMAGQSALGAAKDKSGAKDNGGTKDKSGANAMAKGTSGGSGDAAIPKGGSNSLSGSGKKD